MNQVIAKLILICILTGCTFRESYQKGAFQESAQEPVESPVEQAHEQNTDGKRESFKMSARYDWKKSDLNNKYFKAERTLVEVSKNVVKSVSSVTLPVQVPNPLVISTDFLPEIKNTFSFAKAVLSIGDLKLEVPVEVTFEPNSVSFLLNGLSTVVTNHSSSNFMVSIEFFSSNQKIFTYIFDLRVPPKNIQVEGNVGSNISNSLKRIELGGNLFTLIQAVEIKNNETIPVEVKFNGVPSSSLYQEVITYNYQDLGCDSGEYRYGSNAWNDVLTDFMITLPLDQKVMTSLKEATRTGNTQIAILNPNESKVIGVYAKFSINNDRLNNGSLQGNAQTKGVFTHCHKVVTYCEPHVGSRGEYLVESTLACEYRWDRDVENLLIGEMRKDLFLRFQGGQNLGTFRFNDHESTKDLESRVLPLMNEVGGIKVSGK